MRSLFHVFSPPPSPHRGQNFPQRIFHLPFSSPPEIERGYRALYSYGVDQGSTRNRIQHLAVSAPPLPSNLGKAGWANGCTVLYLLTALVVKRGTANDISRERTLARLEVGLLFFFGEMTSPCKRQGSQSPKNT